MDEIEQKYSGLADPGIRDFLIAGERFYPPDAVRFTMAEQRAFYDRYCAHFRKPRPAGVTAEDMRFAGIACRHYRPKSATDAPLMVYLHGGGFVLGGLDSHDDVCAELCDGAQIEVVAVDYRLAPEHPFPAAFEDCWTALKAIASISPEIIVAGDSAVYSRTTSWILSRSLRTGAVKPAMCESTPRMADALVSGGVRWRNRSARGGRRWPRVEQRSHASRSTLFAPRRLRWSVQRGTDTERSSETTETSP